ncbi:DUF5615 family PIN-like protein [Rubinisphaera italica]|uniref:DUF5615 domain-containing protein n=1 Tax=Rubinisphaera italica TaxID=2527969 RepID=A0A5C5XJC5_9PLAN|nr:DUF5615 family PIN-like protein [Rubinisphaera italica]TWT62924.1 hypothetical protein Pan54_36750 [Rubinisphaera italica]
MKWLVDAQLPKRLSERLNELGQDSIHTLELPEANRTTDDQISQIADGQNRAVVSKDSDFLDSHLVTGSPKQFLWVKTGNLSNNALLTLFENKLIELESAFQQVDCVELTQADLILHQ